MINFVAINTKSIQRMKLKNLDKHIRYFKGPGLGMIDKYQLHKRKRYESFNLNFFGKEIRVPDAGSFLGVYQEMFIDEIYKFNSKNFSPVIIDCGSNIGLSILYFKQLYPTAKIIGFEADPDIYNILYNNISIFGHNDVELINKAVWTKEGYIEFQVEGGASGMITDNSGAENVIRLPSIRLKDTLRQFETIDFLKVDIEGAEYDVIQDCQEELHRAHHLFIEYHSMDNKDQQLSELLTILHDTGFRYHITEAFTSPHPFIERNTMTGMDLLLNIYAWKS